MILSNIYFCVQTYVLLGNSLDVQTSKQKKTQNTHINEWPIMRMIQPGDVFELGYDWILCEKSMASSRNIHGVKSPNPLCTKISINPLIQLKQAVFTDMS